VNLTDGPGDCEQGGSGAGSSTSSQRPNVSEHRVLASRRRADRPSNTIYRRIRHRYGGPRYSLHVSGRFTTRVRRLFAPPHTVASTATTRRRIPTSSGSRTSRDQRHGRQRLIHFEKTTPTRFSSGAMGPNAEIGGHGIDAATYPFASAIPHTSTSTSRRRCSLPHRRKTFGLR